MITSPDSLQTWDSVSYTQAMAQALQYASAQNIEAITPGATSGSISGQATYSLLLTDAADVALTTAGGQTLTVSLPAGYQPLRISHVTSVSAGTAYALY
jgi:hypothetical protein